MVKESLTKGVCESEFRYEGFCRLAKKIHTGNTKCYVYFSIFYISLNAKIMHLLVIVMTEDSGVIKLVRKKTHILFDVTFALQSVNILTFVSKR